jgi:hypothetical protein
MNKFNRKHFLAFEDLVSKTTQKIQKLDVKGFFGEFHTKFPEVFFFLWLDKFSDYFKSLKSNKSSSSFEDQVRLFFFFFAFAVFKSLDTKGMKIGLSCWRSLLEAASSFNCDFDTVMGYLKGVSTMPAFQFLHNEMLRIVLDTYGFKRPTAKQFSTLLVCIPPTWSENGFPEYLGQCVGEFPSRSWIGNNTSALQWWEACASYCAEAQMEQTHIVSFLKPLIRACFNDNVKSTFESANAWIGNDKLHRIFVMCFESLDISSFKSHELSEYFPLYADIH